LEHGKFPVICFSYEIKLIHVKKSAMIPVKFLHSKQALNTLTLNILVFIGFSKLNLQWQTISSPNP
jgi:hypothetical protein